MNSGCFDNLVGLRGLCNSTHNSYVNDLSGITFNAFAQSAGEEHNTGSNLFKALYQTAIENVKSDVVSNTEYKSNYIAKVDQIGSIGDYFREYEDKYIQIIGKVDTKDAYVIGRIVAIEFISDRDTCSSIYIDGEKMPITVNEGFNRVDINKSFSFKSEISMDTTCFNIGTNNDICDCTVNCKECESDCVNISYYRGFDASMTNKVSSNIGIRVIYGCECDIDKFLCPYASLMKQAIKIKIGILLMLQIVSDTENCGYFIRAKKSQAEYWLSRWEGTTNLQTGFRESSEYWREIKKIAGQVVMQRSMCNTCQGISIKSIL